MKALKALTYLADLLAATALARPSVLLARLLMWPFKLVGGALTPILGIVSGLGALLGLVHREWRMAGAGAVGMALVAKFLRDVPGSAEGFDAAFGSGWERRIPTSLQLRMLPRRWSLLASEPGRSTLQRDLVYGRAPSTGNPLLADLWSPTPDAVPTGLSIVFVHGGGWRIGDKDMLTRPFFRRLAAQGHTVLDIAYTLCPEGDVPTMIAEVKEAVLWLKAHSREYGLDPERVVLMGGSAGGHLALLAGYTAGHPSLPPLSGEGDASVRGVVAVYPFVDLLTLQEPAAEILVQEGGARSIELDRVSAALLASLFNLQYDDADAELSSQDRVPDMLGGTPGELPERYRLLSPISHVGPHCPPTLLLQGTDDIFGLAPSVRHFHQALRAAGATSILVEFPHAEHAFDLVLPRISPVAQAATYDVERFLALLV